MANGDPPVPPPATPPAVPPDARDLYGHCMAGYQYRDQLVPQEFMFMTQGFFFLMRSPG